jgi:Cys-rich four helix bundle protein (predicted Tat secretion target)
MNRRELLGVAVGGVSFAAAANSALAEEHDHRNHAAHADLPHAKLSVAARNCVSAGDLCMSHCLALFAKGDTSLAPCAKSVFQMAAMCEAVARLAAPNSEHLAELAPNLLHWERPPGLVLLFCCQQRCCLGWSPNQDFVTMIRRCSSLRRPYF